MKQPRWRARLSLRLVLAIALSLILIEGLRMVVSYHDDSQVAQQHVRALLIEATRERAQMLSARLADVMQATHSAAWFLSSTDLNYKPSTLLNVATGVVKQSPLIYGSAVAFPSASGHGAFYVHRDDSGIMRIDYAQRGVDYSQQQWFKRAHQSGIARWSKPYFDSDIGNATMVTYSMPWPLAGGGNAVITADVTLSTLTRIIEWHCPWDCSIRIVGKQGRYLAHVGNIEPVANDVFTAASTDRFVKLAKAARHMTSGQSGLAHVHDARHPDDMLWVSYAPIGGTGWSLMALASEKSVLADAREQLLHQLLLSLAALLLVLTVVIVLTRYLTRPLDALRRVAGAVSAGDHSQRAGIRSSSDEISQFAQTFDDMLDTLETTQTERLREAQKRHRLEGELAVAHDLQRRLLPPPWAEWCREAGIQPGFTFHGLCRFATLMSGDFYDVYLLDDNTVALVVADICDKGTPAALYMAQVRTHLRDFATPDRKPAETLAAVNDALTAGHNDGMFATLLLMHYRWKDGQLDYACAGHLPAMIARADGSVERLGTRNEIVGAFAGIEYHNAHTQIGKGETLLLYTDGITEAPDHHGSLYGLERLQAQLQNAAAQPLDSLCATLRDEVMAWCANEPKDDMTLLAVRSLFPDP